MAKDYKKKKAKRQKAKAIKQKQEERRTAVWGELDEEARKTKAALNKLKSNVKKLEKQGYKFDSDIVKTAEQMNLSAEEIRALNKQKLREMADEKPTGIEYTLMPEEEAELIIRRAIEDIQQYGDANIYERITMELNGALETDGIVVVGQRFKNATDADWAELHQALYYATDGAHDDEYWGDVAVWAFVKIVNGWSYEQ